MSLITYRTCQLGELSPGDQCRHYMGGPILTVMAGGSTLVLILDSSDQRTRKMATSATVYVARDSDTDLTAK